MGRFKKIKRKKSKKEKYPEYVEMSEVGFNRFVDDHMIFFNNDNLSREDAILDMFKKGILRK